MTSGFYLIKTEPQLLPKQLLSHGNELLIEQQELCFIHQNKMFSIISNWYICLKKTSANVDFDLSN